MTAGEVKELLKIYYDIPRMIDEEFAVIRNCEAEKNRVTPPPVSLSGLPGGKGLTGDRTADAALAERTRYYDDEIKACSGRIAKLRANRALVRAALDALDRVDRLILELACVGPQDPRKRCGWRAPTWKEISRKVHYSENWTQIRAARALGWIAERVGENGEFRCSR